ncbi:hypothetical protein HG535_0F04930 [Zygotorulaspora mrakii]|uniref:Methylated-DNA--protein-cysteine methyltransferase n=1 Tax=Zygotorulaspora mrakii TaxID=42260 RepID=A0A7H9B5K3_ZYGMR|nr:uncharacterized protein HG535_0F04930 [Zygotorulaspora mrakii]QLG73981.1 hypothetical protein HG535_0F04930 [Zygotorulaspora mrakii]
MEETISYSFCEHELTGIMLMMRVKSGKLVYASLGDEEDYLLKSAEQDFQRLSKKTHTKYHLRKVDSTAHNEEFEKIRKQYISVLEFEDVGKEESESSSGQKAVDYEFMFGTPFQRKVWTELTKVPFGGTVTYGQIAAKIALPKAIRGVGTAVGQNKLAIVIPCHRCLPSDGKIGKFRWGSNMKQKLLLHEKMLKKTQNVE